MALDERSGVSRWAALLLGIILIAIGVDLATTSWEGVTAWLGLVLVAFGLVAITIGVRQWLRRHQR